MIYGLNEIFEYRFPIKNAQGLLIDDGSPAISIQNSQTLEYWNGISWQVNGVFLFPINIGSGIYGYDISFDSPGTYLFRAQETTYNIDETFSLTVSDGAQALTGSTHSIVELITNSGEPIEGLSVYTSIRRTSDNKYFDGAEFVDTTTDIPMVEIGEGVYEYEFTYAFDEVFEVIIAETTTSLYKSYSLTFSTSMHESQFENTNGLYTVSSENILGNTGGDARIMGDGDTPVKGAILEVHNKDTKEVFRAVSDVDGKWSLKVPKGTYIFIVSHDDYISVSIEREVS